MFLVEPDQNLEINKIPIARPIFAWEPGLLNIMLAPHKNMPACKKSAIYLKYKASYMLFIFFLEVSEIQWSARFSIPSPTPISTTYLPNPKPTSYLPYTYHIPTLTTHAYQNRPIPTLYQIYFKVHIRQGDSKFHPFAMPTTSWNKLLRLEVEEVAVSCDYTD